MICLHAKFHMPSYNDSFITAIKLTVKENSHTQSHCLQKYYLKKKVHFFKDLLPYIISGLYIK